MSSNLRIPKNCHFCGERFIAKTTTTKFCGDPCSKKGYKARKKMELINTLKETESVIKATENPLSTKEFITRNEAVILFGISLSTLKRHINTGSIPHIKIGNRVIINKESLIKKLSR